MGTEQTTCYTAKCDRCGRLGTDEDDDYGWARSEGLAEEQVLDSHGWTEGGGRLLCADCTDVEFPEPEGPIASAILAVPEPLVDEWCEARGLPPRRMLTAGSEAIMREVER